MNNRILVTWDTCFGATTRVAAAVGKTLAECGDTVDIKPVTEKQPLGD